MMDAQVPWVHSIKRSTRRSGKIHIVFLERARTQTKNRNHSTAKIAGFFASPAEKKSLAASDFWGSPQNHRKLAATTAASHRSCAIPRLQRPRETKVQLRYTLGGGQFRGHSFHRFCEEHSSWGVACGACRSMHSLTRTFAKKKFC